MAVRVGISGFGRIGRLVLRAIHEYGREDLEVVAINGRGSVADHVHLFKYDTVHGRYAGEVTVTDNGFDLGRGEIRNLKVAEPKDLPWAELGVDIVLECTGKFNDRDGAGQHLTAGAKKVLVSAPCKEADLTVVYGVNHHLLTPEHKVVSSASCTTNCLAPVLDVLNKTAGIERGYMTTIHSYTRDQTTVDSRHRDWYRARAAAQNLIPTSTGATKAIALVLPELGGRLSGCAIRVPTANVSLIDVTFDAARPTSVEEINAAMRAAAEGPLKGVLAVNDEKLVSSDFNHTAVSATFDMTQTTVMDGKFVRILAWYDNEWGFSCRMLDNAIALHKVG